MCDHRGAQWLGFTGLLLVFIAGIFAMVRASTDDVRSMPLLFLWFALYVTRICAAAPNEKQTGLRMGPNIILMHYPVELAEVCRATLKLECARCLTFCPVAAAYGYVAAWLTESSPWEGVVASQFALASLLCMQPIFDCFTLSSQTNDTRRVRMWIFWLVGGPLVGAAAVSASLVSNLPIAFGCLTAAALLSWAMFHYYASAYRRGTFDLLP